MAKKIVEDHPSLRPWIAMRDEALEAGDQPLVDHVADFIAQKSVILKDHEESLTALARARAEYEQAVGHERAATGAWNAGADDDETADQLESRLARAKARVRFLKPRFDEATARESSLRNKQVKGFTGPAEARRLTANLIDSLRYGWDHAENVAVVQVKGHDGHDVTDVAVNPIKPADLVWLACSEREVLRDWTTQRIGTFEYSRKDLKELFELRREAIANRRVELELQAKKAIAAASELSA